MSDAIKNFDDFSNDEESKRTYQEKDDEISAEDEFFKSGLIS
jgi:hypothetical protein